MTRFSIDFCCFFLKEKIPHLSYGVLYRLYKKNGLNLLPENLEKPREKQIFSDYKLGFVHIDTTEIKIGKEKIYFFVAVERTSKAVFFSLFNDKTIQTSADFLHKTIDFFPFKIHTILTDNGMEYTFNLLAKHLKPKEKIHQFDKICNFEKIKHKTTQFRHSWTNGQVEIMNKMIKNATTKKFLYSSFE